MADAKITALGSKTTPTNSDIGLIVDVADTTMSPNGTDKQITLGNLPMSIATKSYVDATAQGLTADLSAKEVLTNKATDFTTLNNTLYPTTQAVQNAITSATVGLLDYRGSYDVSGNTYPSSGGSGLAGVINKGDFWICSVAGTLNSTPVSPGDLIIALVDLPGSTNANWDLVAHDSDLSIYALKTTTVNGYALSSNVTVTASDVGALPISGGTLTGDLTLSTHNLITDTTTGTKIGTATTQKIGHYGSTPVVQQAATTDLGTVLSAQGFRAAGTAYPITTSGTVSLSGYVSAPNINQGLTSTVTAAGTTTLVYTSPQTQIFTGTSTQILKLPTTSVAVGWDVVVINQSTGLVTVTASGGTTVQILAPSTHAIITALAASPTTNTQWDSRYIGSNNASGKSLTTNNTLTLAGTDGTTMTMPSATDTLVGRASTDTLTNKDLSSATNTIPLSVLSGVGTNVLGGSGSALVTSSTSYVDFTALGSVSVTTASGKILVMGAIRTQTQAAGQVDMYVKVMVGSTSGTEFVSSGNAVNSGGPTSVIDYISVTPGTYTVKVQVKLGSAVSSAFFPANSKLIITSVAS